MSTRPELFIRLYDANTETAMRKHVGTLDRSYTQICLANLDTEHDIIEVNKASMKPLLKHAKDNSDGHTIATLNRWLNLTPDAVAWPGCYTPDKYDAVSHEIELY